MAKNRKDYSKTKLVIFDINFDDQTFFTTPQKNPVLQQTIKMLINASTKQNLVIFTNSNIHEAINFCHHYKIVSGWIIACNKTAIYDLKARTYLHFSCLKEDNLKFIMHLALIYSANMFVCTTKNNLILKNNLLAEDMWLPKRKQNIFFKNSVSFEKKIKKAKVLNAFLKFCDGFKTSNFYLKIKDFYRKTNDDLGLPVGNDHCFIEIINKSTILFKRQISDFDLIWYIAQRIKVFATSDMLYYPINHLDMGMYLQCRHHVLNSKLYTSIQTLEHKYNFCVDKTANNLSPDFGATTNNFWKSEKKV